MTRTIFLKFNPRMWTEEELDNMMKHLSEVLPEDVDAMALPKDVSLLSEDEIESMVETLTDSLDD
jgi:hypothetical protein